MSEKLVCAIDDKEKDSLVSLFVNMQEILNEQAKENRQIKDENKWLKLILDKQFQLLCLFYQNRKQSFAEVETNPSYYAKLTGLLKECNGLKISSETAEILSGLVGAFDKTNNADHTESEEK